MSTAKPDPTAASAKRPYVIPLQILRGMVLTLPRPLADAPETAWQEVVQGGLDMLGVLDPRDALQTMLAVTVIATHAGAVEACALAHSRRTPRPCRRCASGPAPPRVMAGAIRSLKQPRLQPAALAVVLQQAPARPAEAARGGKVAAEEPAEIIRWIDEIDDAKMNEEIERVRREAAGKPPLPMKPGPRRIYKCKPDDYALTWVPNERAARTYPA